MDIKPIRTDEDLKAALARVDEVWGAAAGTPEGEELEMLVLLIESYEEQQCLIPPSDPTQAVNFRLDQQLVR